MQNFVAEGMEFHCYGYTGCTNFVSGGRSALIYKKNNNNDNNGTDCNNSSRDEVKLIFNPLECRKLFKKKTENVQVRSAFSNKNGFKSIKSFQHQDPILPAYTFDDLPTYSEVNELTDNVDRIFIRYCPNTYVYDRFFGSSSTSY